jgi:hypothetical protein
MTWRRAASVLVGWLLLVLLLAVSDARPAVWVLGGIVAAIGSAVFVLVDLADSVEEEEWTRRARRQSPVRSPDARVSSVRRKAQGSWWSGASDIGTTLVELVDDRLLAHHHVDRTTDPTAATALLTPALRDLVAAPRRASFSPRDLQTLLSDIEAL